MIFLLSVCLKNLGQSFEDAAWSSLQSIPPASVVRHEIRFGLNPYTVAKIWPKRWHLIYLQSLLLKGSNLSRTYQIFKYFGTVFISVQFLFVRKFYNLYVKIKLDLVGKLLMVIGVVKYIVIIRARGGVVSITAFCEFSVFTGYRR